MVMMMFFMMENTMHNSGGLLGKKKGKKSKKAKKAKKSKKERLLK